MKFAIAAPLALLSLAPNSSALITCITTNFSNQTTVTVPGATHGFTGPISYGVLVGGVNVRRNIYGLTYLPANPPSPIYFYMGTSTSGTVYACGNFTATTNNSTDYQPEFGINNDGVATITLCSGCSDYSYVWRDETHLTPLIRPITVSVAGASYVRVWFEDGKFFLGTPDGSGSCTAYQGDCEVVTASAFPDGVQRIGHGQVYVGGGGAYWGFTSDDRAFSH